MRDENEMSVLKQIRMEIEKNLNRDIGGNNVSWISGYKSGLGEALEIISEYTEDKT